MFPTSSVTLQRPLLKGRQKVAALWFPNDWFDEAECARRVLAHWRTGGTVLRFAQGVLLRYVAPEDQLCEALGGWPLACVGHALCTAPLSGAEAAAMPAADVWLVLGAQVTALNFADATSLDPSAWLAVDGLVLHDTFDCRLTLAPATELAPMVSRDLREVLEGRVPAASKEQQEFVRELKNRRESSEPRPSVAGVARRGSTHSAIPWLKGLAVFAAIAALMAMASQADASLGTLWMLGLIAACLLLLKMWGGSWATSAVAAKPVAPSPPPLPSSAPPAPARPGPALPERRQAKAKPQAWRRWLARLAITSQVSRLLGRRQAAYVRKMMALFESGQLDEALRHAIPLGGDLNALGQAFGVPNARDDLSLSHQPGASLGIQLGEDLDAHLRRLYRSTFEKLDREGRVDEACFVLAELLKSHMEALDYLEKKQRYRQAAELALAWDSAPDVIVRLHCLAGNWQHAVAVARRDNAFANAVLQLEKRWPDAAARLREEWARSLAVRGDWLGAVEVIWPLVPLRALAVDWLVNAESAGGRLGARALVKRAVLLPETWVDCADRLEALRDDPQCVGERAAVAEALLALKDRSPRAQQFARIVLPGVLADQRGPDARLTRTDLQSLVALAASPLLRSDLPATALPARSSQELRQNRRPLTVQVPEAGGLALLDAVALDDGRHLIALGEPGAAIVDARGKIVARFVVPTEHIVIAKGRQVALAVAQRDRVSRVSRLDLVQRRSTDLGLAELAHVNSEFDGIAWTVGQGTRLRVLDTQSSLQDVLWQVADLPGQVRGLSVNDSVEQIVIEGDGGALELWRYALPLRRLMARGEALPDPLAHDCLRLLNPSGGVIDIASQRDDQGGMSVSCRLQTRTFLVASGLMVDEPSVTMTAEVRDGWLFVSLRGKERTRFLIVSLGDGQMHASFDWPTASQPRMRIACGHCTVFDTQGRLWSLDTMTSVMREFSIF
ncbi:MAG: hypothetical protein RLZZ618_442 [Pseudomonadota bacterium]|jgi:hypothetical protein